jgi:DNA-nicking Smr family endonuclease
MDEPTKVPIDGVLDLHSFRPQEMKEIIPEYLAQCRALGLLEIRLIHGKGIGQLRQTVHAILRRVPEVTSFSLAGEAWGGTGATIVRLSPAPAEGPDS